MSYIYIYSTAYIEVHSPFNVDIFVFHLIAMRLVTLMMNGRHLLNLANVINQYYCVVYINTQKVCISK